MKKRLNMKKNVLILLVIVVVTSILIIGCSGQQQTKSKLSDLQIEACNSADAAHTCDSRLAEVGIVIKEDCCKNLGKCC